MPDDKIEIENVNTPGQTERLDRAKYVAMRGALLAVLPSGAPGLKVADAKEALLPHLPDDLFPEGKTAGWWLKAVKLDLEAKGVIKRARHKPVHLYRHGPISNPGVLSWTDTDYTYLKRQSDQNSGAWVTINDGRADAVASVR